MRGLVVMGIVVAMGMGTALAEPALPARSLDPARLALPVTERDGDCVRRAALIVEVGATTGERHELAAEGCEARPSAELDGILADGGFAPLADAALDEAAPGLTLVQRKRTVEARYGGKRLGKVTLPAGVAARRAVLVRGKRPYVYVLTSAGIWVAIQIRGGASDWKVADPLAARLRRAAPAGQEIAILPGPEGLTAVSADGTWREVLVAGMVEAAGVDPRASVVWFTVRGKKRRQSLQVLDLLGDGTPRTVMTRFGGPALVIHYADGTRFQVTGKWEGRTDLYLRGRPRATDRRIQFEYCGAADVEGKAKAVGLKERSFLVELARRVKATGAPPEVTRPPTGELGQIVTIPRSRLQLVVVEEEQGCDDAVRGLFDPDAKQFIDYDNPAIRVADWYDSSEAGRVGLFRDAWFSPSGDAWIHDGAIHHRDGGRLALAEYVVLDEHMQPADTGSIHRVFPDGTYGDGAILEGGGWLDVGVHVDVTAP